MTKGTIYILLIFIPLCGFSQSGIVPLPLLKIRDNYTFDNPAAAVLTESKDLKIIHSSYTGLAGNVGVNYMEGNFTVNNKSKNNAHVPGLIIHSEYETDILKRTRVYLRYSWNTKISESIKLSAGLQGGFFNYSVRSSNSSGGVSAFTPDANLGLWVNSRKANLGVSSAQILNSKIRPINTSYTLSRYLIFFADYNLISSHDAKFTGAMKIYHDGKNYKGFIAALILQLKDILSTEINYTLNRGLTYSVGIIRIPLGRIKGDLHFSYFHPAGINNLQNNNRLEANIRLFLNKKISETKSVD